MLLQGANAPSAFRKLPLFLSFQKRLRFRPTYVLPHSPKTLYYLFGTSSKRAPGDLDGVMKMVYQWQEDVEDLEDYRHGGFHPTHLSDRYLDGRYEVVHKLGYGTYSTVWLAKDHVEVKFVALKILIACASSESNESKVLRALGSGPSNHHGRNYVPTLFNEFAIDGPNGRHRCIVSEAVGCSVAQSKDASTTWKFSANVARAISAQVLLGADYVHSCGIVHGGMLSNARFLLLIT